MTWSLPEGSLISGFHSEEQPPPRHLNTRTTPLPSYTALRGTWLGSPARWCWMTPGRGSALRCAHPGSGRKGRKSQRLSCEPAAQTTGKRRNESLPRASPPVANSTGYMPVQKLLPQAGECRDINDRETRNVKSRLPSVPRDCNHPGVPTHIPFPPSEIGLRPLWPGTKPKCSLNT
uniref:Uncharacterized protein n=1 Tax=Anser cygnoides TaxID=8845 RepID=A0A8B9E818_ANSCY